jgi:hypothetical protein
MISDVITGVQDSIILWEYRFQVPTWNVEEAVLIP